MIVTLFTTILIESLVVTGYCLGAKKLLMPILFTSICGNLVTQSLLWAALNLFYQNYLVTLLIAEILIWGTETVLLYLIPANQLSFKKAIFLSLGMNAMSFAAGWFLPI